MISGKRPYYTLFDTITKMWNLEKDAIGDVFVKYLDPINLHEYLQANGPKESEMVTPKNFETTALQLTTHLVEKQHMESPVTLNSLLSAWLLQEKGKKIKMSELLKKSGMIYDYLQSKPWVKTYMTVRPMKGYVERHVSRLGFKT